MKYYKLSSSIDLKIVGHYPQSIDAKHHCDVWNEPKFIEHHELTPIHFQPIISNAILHKKSKVTDLISTVAMGFTRKLLISGKLKSILQNNIDNKNVAFFKSAIFYNSHTMEDYWIVYCSKSFSDLIDLHKSTIKIRKRKAEGGTFLEDIYFEDYSQFEMHMRKNQLEGKLFFSNIFLLPNAKSDFLALKYVEGGYSVFSFREVKTRNRKRGLHRH